MNIIPNGISLIVHGCIILIMRIVLLLVKGYKKSAVYYPIFLSISQYRLEAPIEVVFEYVHERAPQYVSYCGILYSHISERVYSVSWNVHRRLRSERWRKFYFDNKVLPLFSKHFVQFYKRMIVSLFL